MLLWGAAAGTRVGVQTVPGLQPLSRAKVSREKRSGAGREKFHSFNIGPP